MPFRGMTTLQATILASRYVSRVQINGHSRHASQRQRQYRQRLAKGHGHCPNINLVASGSATWSISLGLKGSHLRKDERLPLLEEVDQLIVQVGLPLRDNIDDDQPNSLLQIARALGRESSPGVLSILVAR